MQYLTQFFKEKLWLFPLNQCSRLMRWLIRTLRVLIGACIGFKKDECFLKASALTFYTLLSIIPVLAVAFGIAKGFGFELRLQEEVYEYFHDQQALAKVMIDFAHNFLHHAQGGLIAGIGVLLLLWSVLKLLGNTENALNSIWKVSNSRSFLRQFSDYVAIMILLPVFFVASSSITLFITTELKSLAESHVVVGAISPFILWSFWLMPYLLSWILFALIYLLMPNTKVAFSAALLAGIVAGTIYQLLQWVYIHFQIGVASYGAIYGSFAAFPLFLLWVHLSWLIVLFGGEIAHEAESEQMASGKSQARVNISNKALATYLVQACISDFKAGRGPTSLRVIARKIGASLSDLRHIAFDLSYNGILVEVIGRQSTDTFQPAREVDTITLFDIFEALNPHHQAKFSIDQTAELDPIEAAVESYEKSLKTSKFNQPILHLEL